MDPEVFAKLNERQVANLEKMGFFTAKQMAEAFLIAVTDETLNGACIEYDHPREEPKIHKLYLNVSGGPRGARFVSRSLRQKLQFAESSKSSKI